MKRGNKRKNNTTKKKEKSRHDLNQSRNRLLWVRDQKKKTTIKNQAVFLDGGGDFENNF